MKQFCLFIFLLPAVCLAPDHETSGESCPMLLVHDGHSYAFWRAHIDDALVFLFVEGSPVKGKPVNPRYSGSSCLDKG